MQISRPPRAFVLTLTLLASAWPAFAQTPLPPAGKVAKPVTVSIAQYRAQRVAARDQLRALAKRSGGGARDGTKIFKALDKAQIVRRADGATQRADGTRWSALSAGVVPAGAAAGTPNFGAPATETFDVKSLQRAEIKQFERALDAEIAELDAWNTRTNGAYYQPVDAGAIIKQLEKSGQIRTGPTWLQARVEAIKQWFSDTVSKFFDWIGSLFPSFTPSAGAAIPDFGWLIFVFWAVVASLLAFLLVAAYRIFAGNIRFGGRRKKKDDEQLEGEDAELLLLPPDELGERAANFAREGNFREALRHRYIAMLLRLDGRGVWRYDTRRTNWEHIAALRRGAPQNIPGGNNEMVAPLSDLTRRFDRVRYGSAPCDAADWQRFERDATALEAGASSREMAGVSR